MKKVEYINKEQVTKETKAEARRKMTGSELRLFLYLLDMANTVEDDWFPLDRWDVCTVYGMSIASYQRALSGLKDLGYMRKKNGGTYYFDAVGSFKKLQEE